MRSLRLSTTKFKFLAVGIWNTVFAVVIFGALLFAFEDRISYVVILTISSSIAIVQSHLTQRKFVWATRASYSRELARFSLVYGAQYILNLMLLWIAVEIWSLPVFYSQIVIAGILIVTSYIVSSKWTFRD